MINMLSTDVLQVTRRLDRAYRDQIERAGPVLAVLRVGAHFHAVPSPPAPSPVGAHLLSAQFFTWPDVNRHLKKLRRQGSRFMGARVYDAWSKRIADLCANPHRLLAYTVPLLVESQMNTIAASPVPAQEVLLAFLSPLLESDAPLRPDPLPRPPHTSENASIYAVLHAGRVPFALTCHDSTTISRWRDHLEAATVLLLPAVIVEAEMSLDSSSKAKLRETLAEELRSWRLSRPRVGDQREWAWLPELM